MIKNLKKLKHIRNTIITILAAITLIGLVGCTSYDSTRGYIETESKQRVKDSSRGAIYE